MNFSYQRKFFFSKFSKSFTNSKFSFNMLNSNVNSSKFANYFSNKLYNSNLNTLNNCNALKNSILSPEMLSSTALVSNDMINKEDGMICLISLLTNKCKIK